MECALSPPNHPPAAVRRRENEGLGRSSVIICPALLKHQWAREIGKFSGLDTQIIQGALSERAAQSRRDAAFPIINYELVLRGLSVPENLVRELADDVEDFCAVPA